MDPEIRYFHVFTNHIWFWRVFLFLFSCLFLLNSTRRLDWVSFFVFYYYCSRMRGTLLYLLDSLIGLAAWRLVSWTVYQTELCCTTWVFIAGGHSKYLRCRQKPVFFPIFANNIRSYLLWSPEIAHKTVPGIAHHWADSMVESHWYEA